MRGIRTSFPDGRLFSRVNANLRPKDAVLKAGDILLVRVKLGQTAEQFVDLSIALSLPSLVRLVEPPKARLPKFRGDCVALNTRQRRVNCA